MRRHRLATLFMAGAAVLLLTACPAPAHRPIIVDTAGAPDHCETYCTDRVVVGVADVGESCECAPLEGDK